MSGFLKISDDSEYIIYKEQEDIVYGGIGNRAFGWKRKDNLVLYCKKSLENIFQSGTIYKLPYKEHSCWNLFDDTIVEMNLKIQGYDTKTYRRYNLDEYFNELDNDIKLITFNKKELPQTFIEKLIRKTPDFEYIKATKKYYFQDDLLVKIYIPIIKKIKLIENSDFYMFHSDRVDSILTDLIKMYEVCKDNKFDKYLNNCSEVIKGIVNSIYKMEKQAKELLIDKSFETIKNNKNIVKDIWN